ncbi:uncharacterized protein [Lolium perenne]|uniref:uncharacterized protein isoform X2 n=1 Tax=Lolium perenne TaxID=4522 RepID=UPI003A98EDDA
MTGKYFSGKQYQWRRSQQLTCSSVEEGHEDQGRDLLHTITPDLVFIIDDKSHKVFTRCCRIGSILPHASLEGSFAPRRKVVRAPSCEEASPSGSRDLGEAEWQQ